MFMLILNKELYNNFIYFLKQKKSIIILIYNKIDK